MLSWSSQQTGVDDLDLDAVASGRGDAGIPMGRELLRFASAAAITRGDTTELDAARAALIDAAGWEFTVDAAAVAANFHMMTRLADGTGARYPEERLAGMAPVIAAMGTTELTSRR